MLSPIEKAYHWPQKESSLSFKWWLITLNHFCNQCSLKSYNTFETNGRKERSTLYGHCKEVSWPYVYVNLCQLSPWILFQTSFLVFPKRTVLHCALVFSFPFTLLLCGLLYAYVICEGITRGDNRVWSRGKLFGAILFLGTFSDRLWATI